MLKIIKNKFFLSFVAGNLSYIFFGGIFDSQAFQSFRINHPEALHFALGVILTFVMIILVQWLILVWDSRK